MNNGSVPYIKVCGITQCEDALEAVKLGVDAIGFVMVKGSSRYIEACSIAKITKILPNNVRTVGVFCNEPLQSALNKARIAGINSVQLHGNEPPEYCRAFFCDVIKRLTPEQFLQGDVARYKGCQILVDSGAGDGKLIAWQALTLCKQDFILAGGLNEHNLPDILGRMRPYGLDISSGCESEVKGRKDLAKMKRFIELANRRI